MQRVFLIRHGETEWSQSGRHTGLTDLPLLPEGEEDALALATRLSGIQFDHVLSSPLQRAQRTADLAGLGPAEIEPDLAEWNYGRYEGLLSAQINAETPGWNIYRDGCPGGESPSDVTARAGRLIARLRAMEGTIALFSHGHFSRALAVRWIGLGIEEAQHLLFGTACFGILGYGHNRMDEPALALWNMPPRELA
ncbi:histidine phosphatase family protein [Aestuariivirga sp.]|uniref:histidine phosphatase family protein n=1 Tax=Aestuariivirga sp. TaxID=2650926 RepID=UPI0039E3B035